MMSRYLLFGVCLGLTSYLCKAQVPDNSGIGNVFTAFDTDGVKVVAGINCHKSIAANTTFTLTFMAYEVDQAEDDKNVKYFDYQVAQALDREMIDTMDMKQVVNCSAFYMDMGDAYHIWEIEIDEESTDPLPCGIMEDGTDDKIKKFAFKVSRYGGYDAWGDRIFLGQCKSDDDTQTLLTMLGVGTPDKQVMVQVTGPAKELLTRRYMVTPVFIDGSNDPDFSTDSLLSGAVDLGVPVALRICLKIMDDRTMFDADGLGVIGIAVKRCLARRAASQGVDTDDPNLINDDVVFLENYCATNKPVARTAEQYGKMARFLWRTSSTDGANAVMFPPNCWYFGPWEAVAFAGKNIQNGGTADRITEFICELEYCVSSGDTKCFGNGVGDGSEVDALAYTPGCQNFASISRKRREADNAFANLTDFLPKTVSTTLTVRMTEGETGAKTDTDEDCFDTPTFYALTAVLTVLLVIVMAIAGFLALKLRSVMNDIDSHDSKVGIQNKAYY